MHKVFISYHHAGDQLYKDQLLAMNRVTPVFIDQSVDTGNVPDHLDDQVIRQRIRDEFLRDTTITIVLVGMETRYRKHVDWEIYSSMYDGAVNKRSGILVIQLPDASGCVWAAHGNEKDRFYPEIDRWVSVDTRAEFERRHPYLPDRIIDNLLAEDVKISVTNWAKVANTPVNLRLLIENAFEARADCTYDLSRPMRRANG